MSLINFHRILIAVAILFCAGYGAFELVAFTGSGGEDGSLVMAGVFFLFAGLLTYYLWRLKRFLGVDG